jgi:hypothetical protein
MVGKTIYVVYKDYEVLFRGLITLHFLNGVLCCTIFHWFLVMLLCTIWYGQFIVEKAEKSDIPNIDKKKWVFSTWSLNGSF